MRELREPSAERGLPPPRGAPRAHGRRPGDDTARLTTFRPWWAWWGAVAAWWAIDGWITALQVHAMRAADEAAALGEVLLPAYASAWLWVPFTMLALWAAARFPIDRDHLLVPVLAHAAGALVVAVLRGAAVVLLNPWVGWYAVLPSAGELLVTSLRNNVLVYWMLVGVGHAVYYGRAARRHRAALAEAQLHVLESQLQPHFLFNALNTVVAHIRSDPATAERIIDRLSRLLRNSLEGGAAHEVPLRDELAMLEPYLEIEQARFEERLIFRVRVDDAVLDALVPHLLLQPLVENAVRHGVSRTAAHGTVEIAAARRGDRLEVCVSDDGAGLPAGFRLHEHAGIGLRNTAGRLAQLYGAAHTFELDGGAQGGTRVRVMLPLRRAPAAGAVLA